MAGLGLKDLLIKVNELTNELIGIIDEKGAELPNFAADSPDPYKTLAPESYVKRQVLNDLLQDMIWLVQGPEESIFNFAHSAVTDGVVLDTLNYFDFWSVVPLDGDASYTEIAAAVSLPEEAVRRILEHAVTIRIFAKVDTGSMQSRIRHNSRSATLARTKGLRAVVSTTLGNAGPSMSVLPQALDKFHRGKDTLTRDMSQTAFSLMYSGGALGKYENTWEFIEADGDGEAKGKGWRQREMVESMRWIKESLDLGEALVGLTDWKSFGKASVVDVGGSAGHDDVVLAENFPDLAINVQDLPQCQPDFDESIPSELKGQITFRAHDFFQPQPVEADVYLLKFIFYDWPKPEAVKILQALRPALKPGAKIVIMEFVGSPPAEGVILPRSLRKTTTSTDVRMMALFGHSERTAEDVEDLFKTADEKFEIQNVDKDSRPPVLMMEVVWRG